MGCYQLNLILDPYFMFIYVKVVRQKKQVASFNLLTSNIFDRDGEISLDAVYQLFAKDGPFYLFELVSPPTVDS